MMYVSLDMEYIDIQTHSGAELCVKNVQGNRCLHLHNIEGPISRGEKEKADWESREERN